MSRSKEVNFKFIKKSKNRFKQVVNWFKTVILLKLMIVQVIKNLIQKLIVREWIKLKHGKQDIILLNVDLIFNGQNKMLQI